MRAERHSFVGRLQELSKMLSWRSEWLAPKADESPAALVSGPAGSGKSRLAREFVDRVPAHEVVWIEGSPGAGNEPFRALASGLGIAPGPEDLPGDRTWSGARFRLREELMESLSERAARSAVLIIADDAQWLDSGSLETLFHAARRPGIDCGVGVLLLSRPAAVPSLLARTNGIPHIELSPLDSRSALDLATMVLGRALTPDEATIMSRGDRNPLFIMETANGLRAKQSSRPELLQQPAFWFHLAPTTQGIARAAAVIGRRFDVDELVDMLDVPQATVRQSCADLLRLDVISIDGGKRMAFRHDVLREEILDQADPMELIDLHTRRAHAIANSGGNRFSDRVAVAQHLSHALPTAGAAARFADAGAALLGTDPAGATEFYRRALTIDLAPSADLIGGACRALTASNQADEALEILMNLNSDRVDGQLIVREAEARAALGELEQAAGCFERAGATFGPTSAGQRARAEGQLVRALCFQHDLVLANTDALLKESAELDKEAEVHARCARAWVLKERGQIDAALAEANTAVEAAGQDPTRQWRNPLMYRLDVLVAADRYEDLDVNAERARSVALEFGDVWQVPSLSSMLAGAFFRTGEWDRALAEIDAGGQWALETGNRLALPWLLSFRSAIFGARGRSEEADSDVEEAARLVQEEVRSGAEAVLWSRALRLVSEPTEASQRAGFDSLDGLWQLLHDLDVIVRASTIAPPLLRTAKALGKDDRCRELVRQITSFEDRCSGQLPAMSAVRLASEGLVNEDVDSLLDAADLFGRLGLVPDRAATLCDALDLVSGPQTVRVMDGAVTASKLIAELGDVHLARRLPEWVPDSDVGETTVPDPLAPLSRAERRVAELVATGASNPSIAAQLHISRRTVESHLSHIFTKLGITGRVELALQAASPTSRT